MTREFLSPIHKASRRIGLHLQPRMADLGLSNAEAHLLSYLRGYGPAAVGDLQRVFGHRPSTLTGLLDRLEARKLVHRRLDPGDRRSFVVRLTARGERTAGRVDGELRTLETTIRRGVRAVDLQGFRNVLDAIGRATEARPAPEETRR